MYCMSVCTMRVVKWAGIGDWFHSCRALVLSVRTRILPKSSCGLWTWTIGPCPIHDKTTSWNRSEQRRIKKHTFTDYSNLEKTHMPVFRLKERHRLDDYTHISTVFCNSHIQKQTHRLPLTKGGWTQPNTAMRRE